MIASKTNKSGRNHKGLLWWLSPSVAAFIYTVLLKPQILRILAQKIICLFIPEEINIKGAMISLNKSDAIVSGNLAMGCYETFNLDLFEAQLKPGMCVFDVGANIGLYSAIAAMKVGNTGCVVAVEPDKVNCSFIKKTSLSNGFEQVAIHQKAAGDKCGLANLYICDTNKADHRLYDNSNKRSNVQIEVTTLDAIFEELAFNRVDIIKIDTQGFEHSVFRGMKKIIEASPKIKIFMEFWPWGLIQAGESPLGLLNEINKEGFVISEIEQDTKQIKEILNLSDIAEKTLERQHADLFLEKVTK
jgi:FkbM family methyltransferase